MEDTENVSTETEAAAALGMMIAGERVVATASGREYLILPDGFTAQDVSEPGRQLASTPVWIEQGLTLQTTNSLIHYVDRFKRPETSLFADIDANRIVAAIDYHAGPGRSRQLRQEATETVERAERVAHKASLTLPFSVEWKVWTGIDGQLMSQLDFARFLEENGGDVEAPSGAELLEVCRDLQARRKVDFTKVVRTASDNESFEYSDDTQASTRKGDIEIPTKFLLRLPVYFGGESVELYAFLRWRLDEGDLKLGIKLHRVESVRQAEFKRIVDQAASSSDVPAYFGKL